jgi:hypothetical protein
MTAESAGFDSYLIILHGRIKTLPSDYNTIGILFNYLLMIKTNIRID